MSTITADKTLVTKRYHSSSEDTRALLRSLFPGEDFRINVKEVIKTFEDACEFTGENPADPKFHTGTVDDIAFQKLKVITRALNQNVVLDYSNPAQKKWRAWFEFSGSAFRFLATLFDHAAAGAGGGSRLCFVSEDLARYAATQFIHLYNDLLK